MTRSIRKLLLGIVAFLLAGATSVQAASTSYYLNLTNDTTGNIPNGTNYAQVTIDDEGAAGLINFTVTILPSVLTANKGTNFGLQSFGFNVLDPEETVGLVTTDIINLPNSDWTAIVDYTPPNSGGTGQSIFGKFDAVVRDGGMSRVDPTLTFSIDNQFNAFDTISDYIAGSNSNSNSVFFVAHITGFTDRNPLDPVDPFDLEGECFDMTPPDEDWSAGCNVLTSVWVGGSTIVPVPAAVWLFGSALGLLGWMRRRIS